MKRARRMGFGNLLIIRRLTWQAAWIRSPSERQYRLGWSPSLVRPSQAVKLPVEKVEKSSPTLSASFFHWPLIDRQDLSGSFIGRRRMTNQGLMKNFMPVFYRQRLNVCLRWRRPRKYLFGLA